MGAGCYFVPSDFAGYAAITTAAEFEKLCANNMIYLPYEGGRPEIANRFISPEALPEDLIAAINDKCEAAGIDWLDTINVIWLGSYWGNTGDWSSVYGFAAFTDSEYKKFGFISFSY